MARISYEEANQLASVGYDNRVQILYGYLVKGMNQKDLAEYVYDDYSDWASMRISLVTRGYGFHQGRSRGKYRTIPKSVIEAFVQEYDAENYNGGLDEGTFDDFIFDYRQQMEAQRQREEMQRRWEEEEAERRRQQQLEYARQYEEMQRRQEAERRQQEEQARQERLRREQEEREIAARRQAAIARGDHNRLMDESFAALDAQDYALARSKAEQAWALTPMVGLQYIFAVCAAHQGDRSNAIKWAGEALEHYEEGCRQYLDMCVLYLNNGGNNHTVEHGRTLYHHGELSHLSNNGLIHLGGRVYQTLFRMEGGLRLANKSRVRDSEYMQFAEDLSLLIAERIPTDDAHRTLMLNCAFILTRRKHYRAALDIYEQYKDGDCYTMDSPAYDLRAHRGYCYYGLGDKKSVLYIWYPDLMYHPHFDTLPTDILWAYNYDDLLLELSKNHPEAQEHIEFTQQYVDGEIPGSVYFARYFSNWRSRLGLEPQEDTRWYCEDDSGTWHVEVFTPSPADNLKAQAKSFFGKLFGR